MLIIRSWIRARVVYVHWNAAVCLGVAFIRHWTWTKRFHGHWSIEVLVLWAGIGRVGVLAGDFQM